MKDWRWRSYLGIGLANKLKSPVSAKVLFVMCFYGKWQLRWIGRSRIFSPFGGRLGVLHVRDWRIFLEKTLLFNSVWERTQKCDRENQVWRWCQIKPIYMWYLDLVFKRLRGINCLNSWVTNCANFWNQKSCCGTVFLQENDETKTSSGL